MCLLIIFYSVDFNDKLQVIHEAVTQADFLAIDAEFSGWHAISFSVTLFEFPVIVTAKMSFFMKYRAHTHCPPICDIF